MLIRLNGEDTDVAESLTLQGLVEQLALAGQRVAVELNGEVVPRSCWPQTALRSGDRAELVRAIGGG